MTAADKRTCSPDKKTPFAGKRTSSSGMITPSAEETSPDKIAASPDKKPPSTAGPGRRPPSLELRTPSFEMRTPSGQSSACHTADTRITSHAKRTASADKAASSSAFECDTQREKYRCARAGSLQAFDRCLCMCVRVCAGMSVPVFQCTLHICACVNACIGVGGGAREANRRGNRLRTYTWTWCVDT